MHNLQAPVSWALITDGDHLISAERILLLPTIRLRICPLLRHSPDHHSRMALHMVWHQSTLHKRTLHHHSLAPLDLQVRHLSRKDGSRILTTILVTTTTYTYQHNRRNGSFQRGPHL